MDGHSYQGTPSPGLPVSELREVLGASVLGGAGWLRARRNAVVVQVLWRADHTEIAAHTLQGAGAPDSIAAALDRVAEIVTAIGSG
ncbi:hypothetical protein [Nesterenkonia sp. HG001]|uniref:hypothetical protein n=1 Tax=Nesterenkonia sp. HG001 TaxID=2983207 RepID=UPI002AC37ABE|nr:hypothetical protein [Nesterenkonia sp. HG001]MDZ5076413.1 hypothetical protein [Nesterenkonia sp. HG001]